MKRIALERKQKQMTIQIPDEIVVQELALRLKATVAEVVKKAFLMGTMVTATDTIDFDTASLIAMEFHAKVEKEVVVTGNPRVYKALKKELEKVLSELKRLKKGEDVPEDLLEVIRLITITMAGMKAE